MKRKHQKTLDAIYARPVSANIQWRDIEALFIELGADISEREGSRIAVVYSMKSAYFIGHTPRPIRIKVQSPAFANGLSNTESLHEFDDLQRLQRQD